MTSTILSLAISTSQLVLGIAMCLSCWRLIKGPRAQDRVLALDSLYLNAMLMLVTFGISTSQTIYFEAALVIGLLSFVATAALAKFLMRGEVIE
ncbi:K+/H+ antiporter subunit F [Devosia sp. ZB163]|uniref:K+/H+ antiporter subunit F n=1 Tax=Devosia sp. ZB163 TaxID=3025938 RepID=UPI0023607E82|nr:K+/H+ antiporter subunit F [Devosia sp. ZB163]MDC9826345.1 K+/H+ antiporter subunit F [Devosia sp. ZB163]